jgi:hypothetical protein
MDLCQLYVCHPSGNVMVLGPADKTESGARWILEHRNQAANQGTQRFVLFLVFFRYNTAVVPEEELGGEPPRWQEVLMVSSLILLHGLGVLIVTAILSTFGDDYLTVWASLLGVMAAGLAAIQYLPQIWTTYRLKHVGSLSIPMMIIQTPGGFLFATSLYLRLGPAGWSSWGIFLLTATMQGILLSMAIRYELQARRERQHLGGRPKSPDVDHQGQNGGGTGSRRHLYANGFDDETPGRYENHPEHYADSPEQLPRILDRQDADAATENTPLLRPGGIGTPNRNDVGEGYQTEQRS